MRSLLKLSLLDERAHQIDAANAILSLSRFGLFSGHVSLITLLIVIYAGLLLDPDSRKVLIEATSMLVLSRFLEPRTIACRTLAHLSQYGNPLPCAHRSTN